MKTVKSAFHGVLNDSSREVLRKGGIRKIMKRSNLNQRIMMRAYGKVISLLCQGRKTAAVANRME